MSDNGASSTVWSLPMVCVPSSQVSFLGEDVESIPPHLCRDSGPTAKRLDLSYNRLKFVAVSGMHSFVCYM